VRGRCWSGQTRVATRVTGEVFTTGARVCERRPGAKRDTLVQRPTTPKHIPGGAKTKARRGAVSIDARGPASEKNESYIVDAAAT